MCNKNVEIEKINTIMCEVNLEPHILGRKGTLTTKDRITYGIKWKV